MTKNWNGYFDDAGIRRIRDAIVSAGLATDGQLNAIQAGLDATFAAGLPRGQSPLERLTRVLGKLNKVARLADGSVPFRDWLGAAETLAGDRTQADVFRRAKEHVRPEDAPERPFVFRPPEPTLRPWWATLFAKTPTWLLTVLGATVATVLGGLIVDLLRPPPPLTDEQLSAILEAIYQGAEPSEGADAVEGWIEENKPGTDNEQKLRLRAGRASPEIVPVLTAAPERLVELRAAVSNVGDILGSVTVPIHWRIIHDGLQGNVPDAVLRRQEMVLNRSYAPAGIRFKRASVQRTDNAAWYRIGPGDEPPEMWAALYDPNKPGLYVFVLEPPGGLLGWASGIAGPRPALDGCFVSNRALPDGNAPYHLGKTLVHNTGHWFGLYHTFQDGCSGDGDEVEDTPSHSGPNFGTPSDADQPHNLCPGQPPGTLSPIHNYMNYVDDVAATEFTAGQIDRMHEQLALHRRDLLPPDVLALLPPL